MRNHALVVSYSLWLSVFVVDLSYLLVHSDCDIDNPRAANKHIFSTRESNRTKSREHVTTENKLFACHADIFVSDRHAPVPWEWVVFLFVVCKISIDACYATHQDLRLNTGQSHTQRFTFASSMYQTPKFRPEEWNIGRLLCILPMLYLFHYFVVCTNRFSGLYYN